MNSKQQTSWKSFDFGDLAFTFICSPDGGAMDRNDPRFTTINEPFNSDGRDVARLVFDFACMLSCFNNAHPNDRVLDFCAGSGWISEWLNRLNYDVYAIDLNQDVGNVIRLRTENDSRLNSGRLTFKHADGHSLPFSEGYFGHVCSFDSLHHMTDYQKVLGEMHRVLEPGGRAIFVEPGAQHSTSKSTIEFISQYKKDDPTWVEKDVVLDEIFEIASQIGFASMIIRPVLLPNIKEYDFHSWKDFIGGKGDQKNDSISPDESRLRRLKESILKLEYIMSLKMFNYDERVIFYLARL